MKIKQLKELKSKMSLEQKRRLLKTLRTLKEGGNIGGETDIINADNLVAEDEFTAAEKPERNVIAKTFDTQADFDSYVNQRRGIEITPRELQSLVTEEMPGATTNPAQTSTQPSPSQPSVNNGEEEVTTVNDPIRITKSITFTDENEGSDILADLILELGLRKEKPTQRDRFFVKFEVTDAFGNNTTTIIKKLKEGSQFCWTAFSKHETAEEEGKPDGSEKGD